MNEIVRQGDKRMTTKEVARQLSCAYRTVAAYVHKAGWSENGKQTLLDEKQVAVIVEAMKQAHAGGADNAGGALQTSLQGVEATQSRAVRIAVLAKKQQEIQRQIETEMQAEITKLKQEQEVLQIRLSEAEAWYSVKRVLIETGREYSWKPLKAYSLKNGYGIGTTFDQNYGEVNAYHRDVWHAVYGVEL